MAISKKLGATAIATLALTLGTAMHSNVSYASESSFKDLEQASPWAQVLIQEAHQKLLVNGDQEGYFHPLQQVTRQEAAVALAKIMGLELSETVSSSYSDVASDSWSVSAIEAVKKVGWMQGSQGTFRPKDVITREELATIISRATQVDASEGLSALKDNQKISGWAKDSVSSMISSGIMTGSNGSFHPQTPVIRQELAAILLRVDEKANNTNLQTIEKIENGSITIGNTSYRVAAPLKSFFSENNVAALTKAGIRVETADGEITKILALELVAPGQAAAAGKEEFSGNAVLDAGKVVVEGNVKVAADYITIKNIIIKGDFEIGKELNNDFYAENMTVQGTTYVKGGDNNTVVFDQSSLQGMNISKEEVRVEAINKTVVQNVNIESKLSGLWGDPSITYERVTIGEGVQNASLYAHVRNLEINTGNEETSISGNGQLESVTINGSGKVALQGTGTIGSVNIKDTTSQVSFPSNVVIQRIVLPAGVSPEQVILNFDRVKTQIATINGSSNPSYIAPSGGGSTAPSNGGNAGSSGGGSINPANPGTGTIPTTPIPNPSSKNPFTMKSYKNRMETTVDGTLKSSKSGTVYLMAVRMEDNVNPTKEQIKNGVLPGNISSSHATVSITADQQLTYKLEALEGSKAYGIWAVFKNADTGEETQPIYLVTVSTYRTNDWTVLPYDTTNLSQISIQFNGVLTPPATMTTDPAAIFKDGHLRNYGYGFIEIDRLEWDLTIPDMAIMTIHFDPVNLGDGTSYRLDWTMVKNALSIKYTSPSGNPTSVSYGASASYSGPEVVNLITKQLLIETGNTVDSTKGEAVMHILGAYPSPLKQELGLIEFNGLQYQKALALQAGQYTTFNDVQQIISTVNQEFPAPSNTEAGAIRDFNNSQNAAQIEYYLKRFAEVLTIDGDLYNALHQVARTEIAQTVLNNRNLLPESKFTSIEEIRSAYELAYNQSSTVPISVSFVDTDTTAGSIGGDIVWVPGAENSSVAGFKLYWGNGGQPLSLITTVDKNDGNRYTLPQGTEIPTGATQLLVRALLQNGSETATIGTTIKDTLPVAPAAPSVTNDDAKNILIGADASMEFTIDNGVTWISYDEGNPPVFPGRVFVDVRVKADPVNQVPPGKTKFVSFVDNVFMYIGINDAGNTFDTANISSAMEYSSDDGETWTTYDEQNPPQFPGDLTILLREKASEILPAAPARSYTFTSEVHVRTANSSLSTSLPTLEYSLNGGDWIALNVDQVVYMQTDDVVQVREAARGSFPAGAPTEYQY
ncbi:DUF4073 domain-containing protein [Paenibacillus sp. 276b]|uniref:DUF4073 domain-containing protein n=1 Tax=Paenibacillus sp. 276b TaxID=1566277 RepID=UPI00089A3126|nr:DUF4073 domain-containing protein [Paenibacillus sp. 276b]SEB27564.1 S-layer homology domain-containing protein [Paenibacillus sp. 276b]